jgi:hypothetical protein
LSANWGDVSRKRSRNFFLFAANDANGRRGKKEKEREPQMRFSPSRLLALSRAFSSASPISSRVALTKELYQSPIQKTKLKTDGLKHFSSLPSPWGIPLIGHGPLLGRAPAATLMRWAEKYGGVYR